MDFFDIEVFITVVDCKSMNKAAQALHISQSAVSTRIANLEIELGASLLNRSKMGVTLTQSGSKFYIFASHALKLIQTGINETKESLEKADRISIGITEPLYQSILPCLSTIIQDYPLLEWRIFTGRSTQLVHDVLSRKLDIAIVNSSPNLNYQELTQTTLFEERIMLIGPPRYKKNWKNLQYFIQESTFILVEKGYPMRELIENQIFKPLNVVPKKLIEVNTTDLIKDLVDNGVGFSFLPLSTLWSEFGHSGSQPKRSSHVPRKFIYNLELMKPSQKYICISHNQPQNPTIPGVIQTLQTMLHQNARYYRNQHIQ